MENQIKTSGFWPLMGKTLLNREWFCLAVLVFTYVTSLIPITVLNHNTARYVLLWAAAVLLYDLFTNRWLFKYYGNHYLVLFCIGAGLTILFNGLSSLTSGIADFAYLFVVFFLFYTVGMDGDKNKIRKYLLRVTGILSLLIFLNALVSLVLLCLRWSVPFIWNLHGADRYYYLGVSADGRFTGLQGNPNLLGWLGVIGVSCCFILYSTVRKRSKWLKVYLAVNILLQWFCLTLTESRGAALGFYGSMVIFFACLIATSEKFRIEKRKWQYVTAYIAICAFALALWSVSGLVSKGVTTVLNAQYTQTIDKNNPNQINRPLIGERNFDDNFSTGRTVLMETGLKTVVNENLVLGVGSTNAPERWLAYKPANFGGELSDAGNMHNLFLQILLCNGIWGLAVFLLFVFYCIRVTIKTVFRQRARRSDQLMIIALLSSICGFGIISMVENILIYPYTQLINYLFFLLLGCYMRYLALTYGVDAMRDPLFEICARPFRKFLNKRRQSKTEIDTKTDKEQAFE